MLRILKTYLSQIKEIKESDKEHTHRTPLENFLKDTLSLLGLKQSIQIIHEPNHDKEGRGAPDFLIAKDGLALGYIETKRINADLNEIKNSQQIEKYLKLSPNLILTDYLRFCLIGINEGQVSILKEFRICEYSELKNLSNNQIQTKTTRVQEFFGLFFSKNPKPISNAKGFADALALRTRLLKDELRSKEGSLLIKGVFNTFKSMLYKDLAHDDFCDSFAQTLTYSLFISRLNNHTNEKIDLNNVKKYIPKSFPLIRAMSGFLDNLEEFDSIKWLLNEIIEIINHIDIVAIINELNQITKKDSAQNDVLHKDPYLHFYETFLSSYDDKIKELRGVYYTPASIVNFIIESIDYILRNDFQKQEGLASALNDENIKLLDFATGTGTFLLEAFRKSLQSISKNSPKYNPKTLVQQFFGFEYLIAPYTIAHLKISQSLKEEFGYELGDDENLKIALTNTLYYKSLKDEANNEANIFNHDVLELAEEFKRAQNIKEDDILIIMGNPPYSGASSNKGLYEDEVKITYGLEPEQAELNDMEKRALINYFNEKSLNNKRTFKAIYGRKKLDEKNTKWLLDDYVKFIRFAENKIETQGSGIFAFISNNAFLDNPTFRGMRYHLLKTFEKIYILDLHGNVRKKEIAPDGSKDTNVFDIMQGVSINIFVKTGKNVGGGAKSTIMTSMAKGFINTTSFMKIA